MYKTKTGRAKLKLFQIIYLGVVAILFMSCSENTNNNNSNLFETSVAQTSLLKDTILSKEKYQKLKNHALNWIDASKPGYVKNYEKYLYPPYIKWVINRYPGTISEQAVKKLVMAKVIQSVSGSKTLLKMIHYKINDPIKIFTTQNIVFSEIGYTATLNDSDVLPDGTKINNYIVLGISKNFGESWQFIVHDLKNLNYTKEILELDFSTEIVSQIILKLSS